MVCVHAAQDLPAILRCLFPRPTATIWAEQRCRTSWCQVLRGLQVLLVEVGLRWEGQRAAGRQSLLFSETGLPVPDSRYWQSRRRVILSTNPAQASGLLGAPTPILSVGPERRQYVVFYYLLLR